MPVVKGTRSEETRKQREIKLDNDRLRHHKVTDYRDRQVRLDSDRMRPQAAREQRNQEQIWSKLDSDRMNDNNKPERNKIKNRDGADWMVTE